MTTNYFKLPVCSDKGVKNTVMSFMSCPSVMHLLPKGLWPTIVFVVNEEA